MYNPLYPLILLLLGSSKSFSINSSLRKRLGSCSTNEKLLGQSKLCTLFSSSKDTSDGELNGEIPDFVTAIVLKQVFPAMVKHNLEYGNPNIPLGSADGKKLKTLRRLAFQNKLSEREVELLESMNFRFNSLEDIYKEADFDECLQRLIEYERANKCNYQIPKKYKLDPELGAWVTMLRRIGRDNLPSEEVEKLTYIDFEWTSTRKCGSAFMSNYRPLKERLEKCCEVVDGETQVTDEEKLQKILSEGEVKKWISAQAAAAKIDNLSDARCDYMDQLPGFSWRHF